MNIMRRGCCSQKVVQRKGSWTAEEDELLVNYIHTHGEGPWKSLPHRAGLLRCGKSCRFRWMNYLRPDIKRGNITPDEDDIIIRMHMLLGNRWSLIAGRLPGRTDNEIKNYWNTHLSRKMKFQGILPPSTPQFSFRHSKNDPYIMNATNNKGNLNNKNVVDADHGDDDPKCKKYRYKKNVEITGRFKVFTPEPIRISTTSSSRVEVLAPNPIRATASHLSKKDVNANSITSAIGNASNNSCNGRGENCKLVEQDHKFFESEDVVEEKNLCNEICTDCLRIDDGWRVPYQGKTENLVTNVIGNLKSMIDFVFFLQLMLMNYIEISEPGPRCKSC